MQCCEPSKEDVHIHVRHGRLFVCAYVVGGGMAILLKILIPIKVQSTVMSHACNACQVIDPASYVWPVRWLVDTVC